MVKLVSILIKIYYYNNPLELKEILKYTSFSTGLTELLFIKKKSSLLFIYTSDWLNFNHINLFVYLKA